MAYCYCLSIRMKRIISSSQFELFFFFRKGSISTVLFDSVNRGWKCTPEVMFNLLGSGTSSLCPIELHVFGQKQFKLKRDVRHWIPSCTYFHSIYRNHDTISITFFSQRTPTALLILYGSSSDNFHLAEEQMLVNALTDFFVPHD